MDNATKRRAARRAMFGDDETEYTLRLAGSEVELSWQWGDEDNSSGGELTMSVTDLKRLISAAKALLKMTGNDTPLPIERPDTDNI